jgi:hypothetical protein
MAENARLRWIIQNPNGSDFANMYVCLGKVEGKKRLRTDCLRLRVQIPLSGLQAIEKGFSRKARISYQNDAGSNGPCVQWGDVNMKDNTAKKHEENEAKRAKEAAEKKEIERNAELEKKKQEKAARIAKKKAKKWEAEKAKRAVVDCWEDLCT